MKSEKINTDVTFFRAERDSELPTMKIITKNEKVKLLHYVWFFFVANQILYVTSLLPDKDDVFFIPVSEIKHVEVIDKEKNIFTIPGVESWM